MYAVELEKLDRKLKKLFAQGKFDEKNIYLFGASDNSRQIIKILRENGYDPVRIADNDEKKQGSYCAGLNVISVENAAHDPKTIWLIYSAYWREIRLQLLEDGFSEHQIFPLKPRDEGVAEYLWNLFKGKRIYEHIIKEYGDVPVFLCPYTGTGDIYLIGCFWNQYIEANGIKNYVFLVISGACKKVASLFDIKNIVLLKEQKDSEYIIDYYNVCPSKMKLKILNDAWTQVNDNLSEWFRGYKGLYFTELFRKWVFDLPDTAKPEHPVLKDAQLELNEYFDKYKLIPGKTVVLSPYSNTLADLPNEFWEEIAEELKNKGYTLCTNSSGDSEPPIEGTAGVFFPLNIAPQFINYAGGFIGVRSGFCDVVSNCKAKKIILYDSGNRFYNSSAFEYFSLKGMGLCEDAVEIQYKNNEVKKVIEQVINEF